MSIFVCLNFAVLPSLSVGGGRCPDRNIGKGQGPANRGGRDIVTLLMAAWCLAPDYYIRLDMIIVL